MTDPRWTQLQERMEALKNRLLHSNNNVQTFKESLVSCAAEISSTFPKTELFPGVVYYQMIASIFLSGVSENGRSLKVLLEKQYQNRGLMFAVAKFVKEIIDLSMSHLRLCSTVKQKDVLEGEVFKIIDSFLETSLLSIFLAVTRPSKTTAANEELSCEGCDSVYALTARISERPKLKQLLCGIGKDDVLHPEKRIIQAFLFPAVVVDGVPNSQIEHIRYEVEFASSPLGKDSKDFLQGISRLVWSDGFTTIPFQIPGSPYKNFPDRSKGNAHVLHVMENAIRFALVTETCFIDNNPALDFIISSLNSESEAMNLISDEKLKHAFGKMQVLQYRKLLPTIAKQLEFVQQLRQFIVHICRIKSSAIRPALHQILLDVLQREEFIEKSDDFAFNLMKDALNEFARNGSQGQISSIGMEFIVPHTEEWSSHIRGFPLGLYLQRVLYEGAFVQDKLQRLEELQSLGYSLDPQLKDPKWFYLNGGDSSSTLLAITAMIVETIPHNQLELRELLTSITTWLSSSPVPFKATRFGMLMCATIMNVIGQLSDHMIESEDISRLQTLLTLASQAFSEAAEDQLFFMSALGSFYGSKRVISLSILTKIVQFMIMNRTDVTDVLFLSCFQTFNEKFPKEKVALFQNIDVKGNASDWEFTLCRLLRLPDPSLSNDLLQRLVEPKIAAAVQLLEALLTEPNRFGFSAASIESVLESIHKTLETGALDDVSLVRRLCLLWLRFANSLSEDGKRVEWQKLLLRLHSSDLLESEWSTENLLDLLSSLQHASSFNEVPVSIVKSCIEEVKENGVDLSAATIVFLGFNSLAKTILQQLLDKSTGSSFIFVSQDDKIDVKVKELKRSFPTVPIELSPSPTDAVSHADVVIVLQPLDVPINAKNNCAKQNSDSKALTIIDIHDQDSFVVEDDGDSLRLVKMDGLDCAYSVLKAFGIVFTNVQFKRVLSVLLQGVKHPLYQSTLLPFSCSIMKYLLNEINAYDSATRSGIFSLLCECAKVSKYLQAILSELKLQPFAIQSNDSDAFRSLQESLTQSAERDFNQEDVANQEDEDTLRSVDLSSFDAATRLIDQELGNVLPPEGNEKESREEERVSSPAENDMVLTKTTRENVALILSLTRTGAPIIVEGATGAGKSATFNLAASISGNRLVRFNMSQSTSIDDLIGQIQMVGNRFSFTKQPFTEAFENGWWLLLDEINLAKDIVLQCIEEALDTKVLTLRDYSSVENASHAISIKMGKGFRLLATQNPSTGFYKGKREELSQSFFSRFLPLSFKELKDDEWSSIVQEKLTKDLPASILSDTIPAEIQRVADTLVHFHGKFKEAISGQGGITERKAYSEISIRDLLQVVRHIKARLLANISIQQHSKMIDYLAMEVWLTYGSRFREAASRKVIVDLIRETFSTSDGESLVQQSTLKTIEDWSALASSPAFEVNQYGLRLDDLVIPFEGPQTGHYQARKAMHHHSYWNNISEMAQGSLTTIGVKVLELFRSDHFIRQYGYYLEADSWLYSCLDACEVFARVSGKEVVLNDLITLFSMVLTNQFRSREASYKVQQKIIESVDATTFNISERADEIRNLLADVREETYLRAVASICYPHPVTPVVLTPMLCNILYQLARSIRIQLPVLLVGQAGCAKSLAVKVLADLMRNNLHKIHLTSETEGSQLVGGQSPQQNTAAEGDGESAPIAWKNGIVTEAFQWGEWLLLDNINDADACVLERLNPLLEEKPIWTLTEKGDLTPMEILPSFLCFATMTPASNATELSPAFYNRFSNVFLLSKFDPQPFFCAEASEMIKVFLCMSPLTPGDVEIISNFLWRIWNDYRSNGNYANLLVEPLSYRKIVAMLDCTAHLYQYLSGITNPKERLTSSLMSSFNLMIRGQFKKPEDAATLEGSLQSFLISKWTISQMKIMPIGYGLLGDNRVHILPPSRKKYADQLYTATLCNLPILLEGPAAVGKTSLVLMLALRQGVKLERVNNTQNTAIQEYLGFYVPVGDGFEFKYGALCRAMRAGDWFLSDEFNLADPNVMNMLVPILEGAKEFYIPGTDIKVPIHPNFRFFATQNPDGTGKYAGRNKLPSSLRSRFIEVQVGDFTLAELQYILERRQHIFDDTTPSSRPQPQTPSTKEILATALAETYMKMLATKVKDLEITMRELIKWANRRRILFPQPYTDNATELSLWYLAGRSLLLPKVSSDSHRETLQTILHEAFNGRCELPPQHSASIFREIDHSHIKVSIDGIEILVKATRHELVNDPKTPESFKKSLARLFISTCCREPLLLVGPSSYKSLLIKTWSEMTGRSCEFFCLSPQTDASDLIGQMYPYSSYSALRESLESLNRGINRMRVCGSFEEEDGWSLTQLEMKKYEFSKALHHYAQEMKERAQQKNRSGQDGNVESIPNYDDFHQDVSDQVSESHDLIDDANSYPDHDEVRFSTGNDYEFVDSFGQAASSNFLDDPFASQERADDPFAIIEATNLDDIDYFAVEVSDDDPFAVETNDPFAAPQPSVEQPDGDDFFAAPIDESDPFYIAMQRNEQEGEFLPAELNSYETFQYCRSFKKEKEERENDQRLNECLEKFSEVISYLESYVERTEMLQQDKTFSQLIIRLKDFHRSVTMDSSKPIFAFREGPVTKAVVQGSAIVLEDYNLPNQAATERLNSLFEPDRSYSLTEDISRSTKENEGAGGQEIAVAPEFQAFATVHWEGSGSKLDISAATRSRFTEIYVAEYNRQEKSQICHSILAETYQNKAILFVESVLDLIDESVVRNGLPKSKFSIFSLLKTCQLLKSPVLSHCSESERLLLACRFMLLDIASEEQALKIIGDFNVPSSWLHQCVERGFNQVSNDLVRAIFGPPTLEHKKLPLQWLNEDMLLSSYTNIAFLVPKEVNRDGDLCAKLAPLKSTNTVCKNIARVFANFATDSPLLLQGPPGIGKTAIVMGLSKVIGTEVERINFSSSTTLEQLFGSLVPTVDSQGKRIFAFQDGKLSTAIKQKKWILLDEINLAPSEVLESLVPLLKSSSSTVTYFQVPGSDDIPLKIQGLKIVATMNPASIGGGRNKLPRSLENLFTVVSLEGYTDEEIKEVLNEIFADLLSKPKTGPDSTDKIIGDDDWPILTHSLLNAVFEFHKKVREMVLMRQVGAVGGPYEINLRDLNKLHDIMTGNEKSIRDHYKYYQDSENHNDSANGSAGIGSKSETDALKIVVAEATALLNDSTGRLYSSIAAMQRRVQFDLGTEADVKKCLQFFVNHPKAFLLRGKSFEKLARDTGVQGLKWESINAARTLLSKVSNDGEDIRTLILKKFLDLVYAQPFQTLEDQEKIRAQINTEYFPVSDAIKSIDSCGIDISVPDMVRIGTVYLERGAFMGEATKGSGPSASESFVFTSSSIQVLEILASAVQGNRPILLEGDTCSAKSELVRQLASLCRRKLITISLTHETETSSLIGQWLPIPLKVQQQQRGAEMYQIFQELQQFLIIDLLPVITRICDKIGSTFDINRERITSIRNRIIETISFVLLQEKESDSIFLKADSVLDQLEMEKKTVEDIIKLLLTIKDEQALLQLPNVRFQYGQVLINKFANFEEMIDENIRRQEERGETDDGLIFTFVKSDLVKAMTEGHWILLDNVNSAPPEVIERLNSLFEDDPMLVLTEGGGEIFRREDRGRQQKSADSTSRSFKIHDNFRIFATSNSLRAHSYKMSAAFLNRVLRVWLPTLDIGISLKSSLILSKSEVDQLRNTPAFQIIYALLSNQLTGKGKLTAILLVLHGKLLHMVNEKKISLVSNSNYVFRTLLRTVTIFNHLLREDPSQPVLDAFLQAVRGSYMSCVKDEVSRELILSEVRNLLVSPVIRNLAVIEAPSMVKTDLKETISIDIVQFKQDLRGLQKAGVQFMRFLLLMTPSADIFCDLVLQLKDSFLFLQQNLKENSEKLSQELVKYQTTQSLQSKITIFSLLGYDLTEIDVSALCGDDNESHYNSLSRQLQQWATALLEKITGVGNQVKRLVNGSSLVDSQLRLECLLNLASLEETFQLLFENTSWSEVSSGVVETRRASFLRQMNTEVKAVTARLGEIATALTYCRWLDLLAGEATQELLSTGGALLSATGSNLDSGSNSLKYLLQKNLSQPLISGGHSIYKIIEYIEKRVINSDQFRRLAVCVQWICLTWSCLLELPVQQLFIDMSKVEAVDIKRLVQKELEFLLNNLRLKLIPFVSLIKTKGKEAERELKVFEDSLKQAETALLSQKKKLTLAEAAYYNSLNGRNLTATTTTTTSEGKVESKEESSPVNFRQGEMNRIQNRVVELEDQYHQKEQDFVSASRRFNEWFTPILTDLKKVFEENATWSSIVNSFNVATYSTASDLINLVQQMPEKTKKLYEASQCDLQLCSESEFLLTLKDTSVSYLPQPLLSILTYRVFAEKATSAMSSAVFELFHAGIMGRESLGKKPLQSDLMVYFIFDHRSVSAPLSVCVIKFSSPSSAGSVKKVAQKVFVDHICVENLATASPSHRRAFKKVVSALRQHNKDSVIVEQTHEVKVTQQTSQPSLSSFVHVLFHFTHFHPMSRSIAFTQGGGRFDSSLAQFSVWLEESANRVRDYVKDHQRSVPIALRKADPAVVYFIEFSKVIDHVGGNFIGIVRKTEDFSNYLSSQEDSDISPRLKRETEALLPKTLEGKAALAEMIENIPDESLIRNVADVLMKKILDPANQSKILRKRVALKLCDKLQYLMVALSQYILSKTDLDLGLTETLYQRSTKIDRYKKLLKDCIDLFQVDSSEGLLVNDHVEPQLFEDFQNEFNSILDTLDMPSEYRDAAELNFCFSSLSTHLIHGARSSLALKRMNEADEDRPQGTYSEEKQWQTQHFHMEKLVVKLRDLLKSLSTKFRIKPRKLIRKVEAELLKADQLLKSNRRFTKVEVQTLEREIEEFEEEARSHEEEVNMNDELLHKLKRSVASFQFPQALTESINDLINIAAALPTSVMDNAKMDALRASAESPLANNTGESASTAISGFSRGPGIAPLRRQDSSEYTNKFEDLQCSVFGISPIFNKFSLATERQASSVTEVNSFANEFSAFEFLNVDMLLFFVDRYQNHAEKRIRKLIVSNSVENNQEEIRGYLQEYLDASLEVTEKINQSQFPVLFQKMMIKKRLRQLHSYNRHNLLSNVSMARSFYQAILPETGEDYWSRVAQETGFFGAYRTLRYMYERRDDISNIVKSLPESIPTRATFIGLAPKDVLLLCNPLGVDMVNGVEFLHGFEEAADAILYNRFYHKTESLTVLPGVVQELQRSELLRFLVKHISATVNPIFLSEEGGETRHEMNSAEKMKIHPNGLLTSIHEWLPLQVLYGCLLLYTSQQRLFDCLVKDRPALQTLLLDQACLLDDSKTKKAAGELSKAEYDLKNLEEDFQLQTEELRKIKEVFTVVTGLQSNRKQEIERNLRHLSMKMDGLKCVIIRLRKELMDLKVKRAGCVLDDIVESMNDISINYEKLFQALSGSPTTSVLCDGSTIDHAGHIYTHLLEVDNSLDSFDITVIEDLAKK